ncbi:MAG: hypothetical protein JW932_14230 [Deltaproteobacteria bacterium]|nr:hypothetical protein [Deltaproteobacteria bacterium]
MMIDLSGTSANVVLRLCSSRMISQVSSQADREVHGWTEIQVIAGMSGVEQSAFSNINCLIIVHTPVISACLCVSARRQAKAGIQWLFSITSREYYFETVNIFIRV